jgi:hypothetical protein
MAFAEKHPAAGNVEDGSIVPPKIERASKLPKDLPGFRVVTQLQNRVGSRLHLPLGCTAPSAMPNWSSDSGALWEEGTTFVRPEKDQSVGVHDASRPFWTAFAGTALALAVRRPKPLFEKPAEAGWKWGGSATQA